MEADHRRLLRAVKVIGRHGFLHVAAQVFLIVSLCKNALRQAFSDEAAIGFLTYFENNLVHRCSLFHPCQRNETPAGNAADA
jgi:hypothetical protein